MAGQREVRRTETKQSPESSQSEGSTLNPGERFRAAALEQARARKARGELSHEEHIQRIQEGIQRQLQRETGEPSSAHQEILPALEQQHIADHENDPNNPFSDVHALPGSSPDNTKGPKMPTQSKYDNPFSSDHSSSDEDPLRELPLRDKGKTKDSSEDRWPTLDEAKRGVEIFKKLYEFGDKHVQSWLTTTSDGQTLQATLQGLKPQSNLGKVSQSLVALLRKYAGKDYMVTENAPAPGQLLVSSGKGLKRFIEQHPEHVPNYTPKSPIGEHFLETFEKETHIKTPETSDRDGSLHGYPYPDVIAYKKFSDLRFRFKALGAKAIDDAILWNVMKNKWPELEPIYDNLSKSDKSLLAQLHNLSSVMSPFQSYDDDTHEKLRISQEKSEAHEKFLNENKEALFITATKCFPTMSEDARRYCFENGGVGFKGFIYVAANPYSEESKAFRKRVEDTFEQSGMDDFIRQVEDV